MSATPIASAHPLRPSTPREQVRGARQFPSKNRMSASILHSPVVHLPSAVKDTIFQMPKREYRPKTYTRRSFTATLIFWVKLVITSIISFLHPLLRCFKKNPKKIDYSAKAAALCRKFKREVSQERRFELIRQVAKLWEQSAKAKSQCDKMTAQLREVDFSLWCAWTHKTLAEIKESPELLARAADCARARCARDRIWESGQTPENLSEILKIEISNPDDSKRFREGAWRLYRHILPIPQQSSLEAFLKTT